MNEVFSPPSTDAGSQTQRAPRGRVSRTPARVAFEASFGAAINTGCVLKDRYLIESRLGGAVFKATDRFQRDAAKRCVAIKVVQESDASGPGRLWRLRRGFHRAQSLSHETIVKVYELDRIGDITFLTMEFIEGRLLSEMIKLYAPRHMPLPDAWRIIKSLSAGLEYLRSRSVVHGDLNPQNVMLSRAGNIRMLDFGASRTCEGCRARMDASEGGGAVKSTPAYSGWEVLDGRPADPRDDIYSLSCMAYELLTGVHPFRRRQADRSRDRRPPLKRPLGLNRRQWLTLRAGLSWDRDMRPLSAGEWGAGLEPAPLPPNRLGAGPLLMVGHTREHKPLPRWIVVPIIGLFVAVSVLSSIHERPPAVDSRADNSGSAVTASGAAGQDARNHAGFVPANPVATADVPAAAAAAAGSANPPVSVARAQRAETGGASTPAGNIVLPERTYSVRPRQDFAEVRVRRAARSVGDVRFSWWTEPASAAAGTDFVAQSPVTASFAHGMRTASLFVKVLPGDSRRQPKVFYVDVSDLSGAGTPPPVARVAVVLPTAH
jgi:eukaryotic-like serine/threonine-protein kinase